MNISGLKNYLNDPTLVYSFAKTEGYDFIYLDDINGYSCFKLANYSPEIIKKYSWNNILKEAGFLNFLESF